MTKQAAKVIDDLKVKAEMFGMDIDIEALTLVPKNKYKEPIWITRWKEKNASADRQPEDYEGGDDERR